MDVVSTNTKKIDRCRLCGSVEIRLILDLGAQPPANALRSNLAEKLPLIPLVICRCDICASVQLTETVPPEYLFRNYVWVTGTSDAARQYSSRFYEQVVSRAPQRDLVVLEIASNDGTFLQPFKQNGHSVLGVDPAENLANAAAVSGVPTIAEFFSAAVASSIVAKHGQFDVVFARNVLPHVPDPNEILEGISQCLKYDGIGAIEFHWVEPILRELHYDSIYHEHYFYHSLRSLEQLLRKHNFNLFDVTESPISGGSLVVYFSKSQRQETNSLKIKKADEIKSGASTLDSWQTFSKRANQHRILLKELIDGEIKMGHILVGYGASARSSTLLNFCKIDHSHLRCIADQSPFKHLKYTPGTDILIVAPEAALAERPDTVLLLAWNFREEILNRLVTDGFRGNVILPLPEKPKLIKI